MLRALRVGAVVEALSLLILLVNRAAAHLDPVTSITGPVHGSAYLVVIGSALLLPGATGTVRLLALVPGFGGALALWRLGVHRGSVGDPDGSTADASGRTSHGAAGTGSAPP